MSEYMEKHTVSRLIGAPPGYVGFDQGGLLTDAIRRNPYAVLLLDEIEKAHPDVFNILLQVMDHATLTDNNGRKADFRNVILIMTTNAGAGQMSRQALGFGREGPDLGKGKEAIERLFSPEFRNRLDATIPFAALTPEVVERVVDKFVTELDLQLAEKKVDLEVTPAVRAWLAERARRHLRRPPDGPAIETDQARARRRDPLRAAPAGGPRRGGPGRGRRARLHVSRRRTDRCWLRSLSRFVRYRSTARRSRPRKSASASRNRGSGTWCRLPVTSGSSPRVCLKSPPAPASNRPMPRAMHASMAAW
jgi:MoxR-like ATPase